MQNGKRGILDQIAYWFLFAIVFDCAAFGGGSLVKICGIDFRMVLFAAFFLTSLPAVFRCFQKIVRNGCFLLLLIWGLWLVFSTIRGIRAGNRVDTIFSAWIGFASFGILPGILAILEDRKQIRTLMKGVVLATSLLIIQVFTVLVIYNLDLDLFIDANYFMIIKELGGNTGVNHSVVRIFFRSSPYLVVGCACSLYFLMNTERVSTRWLYTAHIALSIFTLVITYTRSIYLCMFVCATVLVVLLAVIMGKTGCKCVFKHVRNAVLAFLSVLLICDLLFGGLFLSYAVDRTCNVSFLNRMELLFGMTDVVEERNEEVSASDPVTGELIVVEGADQTYWSDSVRNETVSQLEQGIKGNVLVGAGMGATLDFRTDGYNEYFFLDMVYKNGVIGLLLYIAPILMMAFFYIRDMRKMSKEDAMLFATWLASMLGFVGFSYFNPYLNGSNGIVVYCCTIGVFSVFYKKRLNDPN